MDFSPLIGWVCWGTVLIPAGLAGIDGVVEAFHGRRRAALAWGGIAGVPAVAFFAYVGYAIWSDPRGAAGYTDIFWLGLFPLGTAFWSILLAYLIPQKPQRTEAPDGWPPSAP
jgi:hypothetical protein